MQYKIALDEAVAQLQNEKTLPFVELMKHGTMSVEYFAPIIKDTQQPHRQDEIYIIASGSSRFFINGNYCNCKAGDLLFVPAGLEHRFEDFSADFATWVIYYGVDGGERK